MPTEVHHPVTNGRTKQMIFLSLIFLFVLSITSLTFMFVSFHTLIPSAIGMWVLKGVFGSISVLAMGGIIYAVHSFFDTRTKAQKDADKLKLKVAKYDHKEEMFRIKHKLKTHKKQAD